MTTPWYRQLWPWLLISGPATVLVAGAITMWIAFSTSDGLVADDYYKQGLAINKRLAREDAARARGRPRRPPARRAAGRRGAARPGRCRPRRAPACCPSVKPLRWRQP
jgi:hypothetical protein